MIAESLTSFLQPGTSAEVAESYCTLATRAETAVFGFEEETAFVDLETTGFDPLRDEIIEAAVLIARGPEVLDRWSTLVRPLLPISHETTQLTGIDDALVKDAPPVERAMADLAAFIGSRPIVAHNAAFDKAFLEQALGVRTLPGAWIDSLEVTRIALPRLRSHRLTDIARAFSIVQDSEHRAGDDTQTLFRVWRIALTAIADMSPQVLHGLARLAVKVPEWTAGRVFTHLAAGAKEHPFDVRVLRSECLQDKRANALADACEISLTAPSATEVLDAFTPGGLVSAMYPGYEARSEQSRMAEAVLDAFGASRSIAIEAGTGVGKSVAYLLPAARFAMRNGVPVGVATKTNTLMDQLVHQELPRLAACLDGELRFTSLKGYEHYVCLRKLQRLLDAPPDAETAAHAAMLLTWTAQTRWGDKEAINVHWSPALRQQILASFSDCTKKHCRFYPGLCYLHGLRREAAGSHIVITNHSLLFRDLTTDGGILPPIRHWVVDEAHAAEAEAREQLSVGAGHVELRGLLNGLYTKGRGGFLPALRLRAVLEKGQDSSVVTFSDELIEYVERATIITDSFFDFLKDFAVASSTGVEESRSGVGSSVSTAYDRKEVRITSEMRQGGPWGTAAGVGRSLARHLAGILETGRKLVTALEEAGEPFAEQRIDLTGQLSAVAEQLTGLVTVLDGTDSHFVYSATVDRRADQAAERLDAFLLDVGEALAEQFYPKVLSVVYTSATIAAGSDFSHFEHAIGFDCLGADGFATLRLDSSYDFERQMAVFVPTDLPEPCQPQSLAYTAYINALRDLLFEVHVAMGGSVLTLFTNRRDMDTLYRLLVEPLEAHGLRLLVQSRGVSYKRVADEFVRDERTSLFATKSFWEGFDAKGDTLRCVVIPRLPFGPVNDPVLEERRSRDRNWWSRYYLPEAVIELKQAVGRLIRSSTDEGCLVLADSRLIGPRSYARTFLDALPVREVERLPVAKLADAIRVRFGR